MAPEPGDKYWSGALYKEGVKVALLELKKPGGVDLKSIRKHFHANSKVKLRSDYGRYVWKALRRLMKSGEVVKTAPKLYKYQDPKLIKKMKKEKPLMEVPIRPQISVMDEYDMMVNVLREMEGAGGSDLEAILKFVEETYAAEELPYDHRRSFTSCLEGMVMDGTAVRANNLYKLSEETLKADSLNATAADLDLTGFSI